MIKLKFNCGLPKERTYVTVSPMAEVLHENLAEIEALDIHTNWAWRKENIFCFLLTVKRTYREKPHKPIYCNQQDGREV